MPITVTGLCIGAAAAALISYASLRLHALTPGGAVAAWVVGTIVFGVGGVAFTVPLLAFFVTSSALSRIKSERKRGASAAYAKTGARDAWQVLANGATPACLAVACTLTAPSAQPTTRDWFLLYLCAIALITADTWATEIGSLAAPTPRLITTHQRRRFAVGHCRRGRGCRLHPCRLTCVLAARLGRSPLAARPCRGSRRRVGGRCGVSSGQRAWSDPAGSVPMSPLWRACGIGHTLRRGGRTRPRPDLAGERRGKPHIVCCGGCRRLVPPHELRMAHLAGTRFEVPLTTAR